MTKVNLSAVGDVNKETSDGKIGYLLYHDGYDAGDNEQNELIRRRTASIIAQEPAQVNFATCAPENNLLASDAPDNIAALSAEDALSKKIEALAILVPEVYAYIKYLELAYQQKQTESAEL